MPKQLPPKEHRYQKLAADIRTLLSLVKSNKQLNEQVGKCHQEAMAKHAEGLRQDALKMKSMAKLRWREINELRTTMDKMNSGTGFIDPDINFMEREATLLYEFYQALACHAQSADALLSTAI